MPTFDRGFKSWAERTSIHMRRELDLRPSDPLSPIHVAKYLGVSVAVPDEIIGLPQDDKKQLLVVDYQSWSAVTVEQQGNHLIIYNPRHSKGRQASDLMHELSHIIIGHPPTRMILSTDGKIVMRTFDQKQEDEAAWLSGCLLLPREALIYIRENKLSDKVACADYCVSSQMLKSRLNLSGVNKQFFARKGFVKDE